MENLRRALPVSTQTTASSGDHGMAEKEGVPSLLWAESGLDTQEYSVKWTMTLVVRMPSTVRPCCHEINIRPKRLYRILISWEGQWQSSVYIHTNLWRHSHPYQNFITAELQISKIPAIISGFCLVPNELFGSNVISMSFWDIATEIWRQVEIMCH